MEEVTFETWYDLYNEFENSDMKDPAVRKKFNNKFTAISKNYWMQNLSDLTSRELESVSDSLSSIWFSDTDTYDAETAYLEALSRLEYSSDRMNFNRWLHIRWLLNLDIH